MLGAVPYLNLKSKPKGRLIVLVIVIHHHFALKLLLTIYYLVLQFTISKSILLTIIY